MPTDWHHQGGAAEWDETGEKHDYGEIVARQDAEESIKGDVSLTNVSQIVINQRTWNNFTCGETKAEKQLADDVKDDPLMRDFYKGMLYVDRMKEVDLFKSLARKYRIPIVVEKW